MKTLRALLISMLLFTSACGYQFQGSTSTLPEDIKTVYIPIVENTTAEPGLSLRFTEILRSRFERYGVLRVVDDKSAADSILNVRIGSITNEVRGVTGPSDIELELEMTMTISAELRRREGQILYINPGLSASESYASTSDVVVTSSTSFAQGGIGSGTLGNLNTREVSRGQSEDALSQLMEEVSRRLYIDSVAADF